MKRIVFFTLTVLLISFQYGYSQEIPEGAIMIDENTIIKDESGNKVEMFKFMELMNSGEWTMDPVNDGEGELLYMQLRKATEEEKKMMSQIPMNENKSELIGKRVPDFKMTDQNGNTVSSKNTKGKIVVLNFWFTACKPCIAEIPELNEVYDKYKNDTNVVFASITFDKKEKVEVFKKKHPIKYPIVSDAKEVCNFFNILGYPTNIVIDKNGKYYDHISGGFPQIGHHISNSIQNALDDKPNINSIPSNGAILDENGIFELENGSIVPMEEAMKLLNSNKYDLIPKKDKNNKEYFLLKKKPDSPKVYQKVN